MKQNSYDMTHRSYLKKLQRTLLDNEQVALIIFMKRTIVI